MPPSCRIGARISVASRFGGSFNTYADPLPVVKRSVTVTVVLGLIVLLLASASPVEAVFPSLAPVPAFVTASLAPDVTPEISMGYPFSTGMAASVALGAPSLTATYPGTPTNASSFVAAPEYATTDSLGNVWVTDFGGNRSLEFKAPLSTGEAASLVLGQTNFVDDLANTTAVNLSSPAAMTIDSRGDVWVSDWGNNRVLEFTPPFSNGMAASLVLGQTSFTTGAPVLSASGFYRPTGLSFDPAGNLWVADQDHNRVMEFHPPFSTGMSASLVLGQINFTGDLGGLTAVNLTYPIDVESTGSIVWVADQSSGRVVGYPAPFSDGEAATYLLGQTSFTTSGATGAAALLQPLSVSTDGQGTLWVSDAGDNRVVGFLPPYTTFEVPIIALGQSTLTGNQAGLSATNLSRPFGAEVGSNGAMWVTDLSNNRVVEYIPATYAATVQETGLPSGTSWTAFVDGRSQSSTGSFLFTLVNGTHSLSASPVPGYRPDPAFSTFGVNGAGVTETVVFTATAPNPFSQGMPATVVVGQVNFTSALSPPFNAGNASSLDGYGNYAAAFDGHGNLWVADGDANRVLEFVPPFMDGMSASLVLGQSDFSAMQAGSAATNLSFPDGLAFAPNGTLWVSDGNNNRVVEFVPPFVTGMAASLVIGQSAFGGKLPGHGAANLSEPADLAYFNHALWVADYGNARVFEFETPFTSGETPSLVLGQSTLTGWQGGLSATNLSDPGGISFDAKGDAWVADRGNNRALEYLAPLATGEAASVALGQPDLVTSGSTFPQSLAEPNGAWVDAHGNVWVADSFDNRVLEFGGPTFVTNQTPILVVGQGNFSTQAPALSRTGLSYPTLALTDSNGNLWVVDASNTRVLGYIPAEYTLKFTETGLPGSTAWSVTVDGTSHTASGGVVSLAEENATYNWNTSLPGWVSSSGVAVVNGANVTVAVTFVPFTYSVTFTEKGLPSGTNWSVTVGSTTKYAAAPLSLLFSEPNGSRGYTVTPVTGYTAANGTGTVQVNAGAAAYTITFSPPSGGSGSSSPFGLTTIVLIVVVIAIVVAAIALLLVRRRGKGSQSEPQPWSPPTGGNPPPGATAPTGPPPPGNGPPPGAVG